MLSDVHISAHSDIQLSCYYSGVFFGPGNSRYYYSDLIPSSGWNKAIFADPTLEDEKKFVIEQAAIKSRAPTFFVREQEIGRVMGIFGDSSKCDRERWMICKPDQLVIRETEAKLDLRFHMNEAVDSDYIEVLTNLFNDDSINEKFRKFYGPTVRNAQLQSGTTSIHAVGYSVEGEPVSCGSIFIKDGLAGLYNIGTHVSKQGRGYGCEISTRLVERGFGSGAREVFLQCVLGTHVEKMYAAFGFSSAEVPALITLPANSRL